MTNTEKEIRVRSGKQTRTVAELRKKSRYFNPNNMLKVFPHDILLEEQAWLRSRIPQHKEALEIIVYKLQDGDMAEEYCDVVWQDHLSDLQSALAHQAPHTGSLHSHGVASPNIGNNYQTSPLATQKFFPSTATLSSHMSTGSMGSLLNGRTSAMGVGGLTLQDTSSFNNFALNPESTLPRNSDILNASFHMTQHTRQAHIFALVLSSQALMFCYSEAAMNQALNERKWLEARDIYLILLEVYLVAPLQSNNSAIIAKNVQNELENPWLSRVLKMLVNKHDRVDVIQILNKLPDKLGMTLCMTLMDAAIKLKYDKKRTSQVTKNLLFQTGTKLQSRKSYREEEFIHYGSINTDTNIS